MRRRALEIGQKVGQETHDRLERRREVSYKALLLTALLCLTIGWVIGLVQSKQSRAQTCQVSGINAIFLNDTRTGEQSGWIVADGAGQATLQEKSGTRFLSVSGYLDGPIGQNLETSSNTTTISPVFMPSVQYWSQDIIRWSNERGLDPNLTATVMQIESCGRSDAESGAGAMGLFQVMPFHFQPGEETAMTDPETNANRGLNFLLESYQKAEGDLARTLAGYNGGHSVITRFPWQWAEETQRFVYWGSGILQDISQGLEQSPRLQEWLEAGGFGLCQDAQIALNLP